MRIHNAVNRVGSEQPTKKENLLGHEQPDSQKRRLGLLLHVIKMMLLVGFVFVTVV